MMNNVEKMSVSEYEEMFGDSVECIQVCEDKKIVAVYVGSEDCPFVGAEYEDGTFSICGLGQDDVVSKDEMIAMLQD